MTHIKAILESDKRFKEAMSELDRIRSIEDEAEREKAIDKASRLIVSVAYDKADIYETIAYQLINAADILLKESAGLIQAVEPKARYKDKFNLSNAMKAINKIRKDFENESIKINEDYKKHGYVENSDFNTFDAIDNNSRLILCFIMLCYNSISQNSKNANLIEAYLRRTKGDNPLFSIEEIESFKINY